MIPMNTNGSKWLALITALLYATFQVLAFTIYHPSDVMWIAADIMFGLICAASIGINLANTVGTNDPWKTWLAVLAIIATALLTLLPISSHVN
jgi:predicted MFS family arabinose efflux permease